MVTITLLYLSRSQGGERQYFPCGKRRDQASSAPPSCRLPDILPPSSRSEGRGPTRNNESHTESAAFMIFVGVVLSVTYQDMSGVAVNSNGVCVYMILSLSGSAAGQPQLIFTGCSVPYKFSLSDNFTAWKTVFYIEWSPKNWQEEESSVSECKSNVWGLKIAKSWPSEEGDKLCGIGCKQWPRADWLSKDYFDYFTPRWGEFLGEFGLIS